MTCYFSFLLASCFVERLLRLPSSKTSQHHPRQTRPHRAAIRPIAHARITARIRWPGSRRRLLKTLTSPTCATSPPLAFPFASLPLPREDDGLVVAPPRRASISRSGRPRAPRFAADCCARPRFEPRARLGRIRFEFPPFFF